MNAILRTSLIAVAIFCLAPAQAQTVDATVAAAAGKTACNAPESLGHVQRRIVEKAAEGGPSVLQFVHRTRMIYQLDPIETVHWLDRRRAAKAACAVALADANPAK